MNIKKLFIVLLLVCSITFIVGCDSTKTSSTGIVQKTPDKLASSVEQDNINNRLQIMNKASTTLFFYGLSDTGNIIFRSTVKGKVTSSMKRLEPITGTADNCASSGAGGQCSSEIIQADGTFGNSDNYVYWFDFEGQYYQWNGYYILTTKPLSVPTPTIDFQATN